MCIAVFYVDVVVVVVVYPAETNQRREGPSLCRPFALLRIVLVVASFVANAFSLRSVLANKAFPIA